MNEDGATEQKNVFCFFSLSSDFFFFQDLLKKIRTEGGKTHT